MYMFARLVDYVRYRAPHVRCLRRVGCPFYSSGMTQTCPTKSFGTQELKTDACYFRGVLYSALFARNISDLMGFLMLKNYPVFPFYCTNVFVEKLQQDIELSIRLLPAAFSKSRLGDLLLVLLVLVVVSSTSSKAQKK